MDGKAEAETAVRQHTSRALHVYQDEDGTVRIHGRLAGREALYQQRRGTAPEADPPTMERQQADALALLAETALHHGLDAGAPAERYQVVVHVDAAVLADAAAPGQSVLEDGRAFQLERPSAWPATPAGC
jgi:hypothetical protein